MFFAAMRCQTSLLSKGNWFKNYLQNVKFKDFHIFDHQRVTVQVFMIRSGRPGKLMGIVTFGKIIQDSALILNPKGLFQIMLALRRHRVDQISQFYIRTSVNIVIRQCMLSFQN